MQGAANANQTPPSLQLLRPSLTFEEMYTINNYNTGPGKTQAANGQDAFSPDAVASKEGKTVPNGEETFLKTIQDLDARAFREKDAFERIRESKARLAQESEAVSEQLELLRTDANTKQVRDLKRRLGALEKRYIELCREENALREHLDYIRDKLREIGGDPEPPSPDADDADSGRLAGMIFPMSECLDDYRTAEHAARRASVPIRRLVRSAKRVPAGSEASFRRYEELHGRSASTRPIRTPLTGVEAACYDFCLYPVDNGGSKSPVLHEKELDALCIKDPKTGDTVFVDAESFGSKLMLETVCDTVVATKDLPPGIRSRLPDGYAKAYRAVEKAIPAGLDLFIQGEVYLIDGSVHVCRVFDRAHAPIVVAGKQARVTQARNRRILYGVAVGIPLLVLAAFVLLPSF